MVYFTFIVPDIVFSLAQGLMGAYFVRIEKTTDGQRKIKIHKIPVVIYIYIESYVNHWTGLVGIPCCWNF